MKCKEFCQVFQFQFSILITSIKMFIIPEWIDKNNRDKNILKEDKIIHKHPFSWCLYFWTKSLSNLYHSFKPIIFAFLKALSDCIRGRIHKGQWQSVFNWGRVSAPANGGSRVFEARWETIQWREQSFITLSTPIFTSTYNQLSREEFDRWTCKQYATERIWYYVRWNENSGFKVIVSIIVSSPRWRWAA